MSATIRHCSRCNTTVEDVGGFCLLGHRLNEAATTGSLSELRAEVDRAFEAAKVQVAAVLEAAAPPPPPAEVLDGPVPVPVVTPAAPVAAAPPAMPWAEAASVQPLPPAPAPAVTAPLVIDTEPVAGDPIVDFAPAPRMDWGPERQGLLKRLG